MLATNLFYSCTTIKQESVVHNYDQLKNCRIISGNIKVTINQVEDKEIAEQIENLLSIKNLSNSNYKSSLQDVCFNICVTERTICENFETKYSVFIYSTITDNNGNILFENYLISKNNSSLTSSSYLAKCISAICENIKTLSEN